MARVTVEDCIEKIPNRFDLVLAAGQRARGILKGDLPTIPPLDELMIKSYLVLSKLVFVTKLLITKSLQISSFLLKEVAKTSIFSMFLWFK